jgi:hypothetical protein
MGQSVEEQGAGNIEIAQLLRTVGNAVINNGPPAAPKEMEGQAGMGTKGKGEGDGAPGEEDATSIFGRLVMFARCFAQAKYGSPRQVLLFICFVFVLCLYLLTRMRKPKLLKKTMNCLLHWAFIMLTSFLSALLLTLYVVGEYRDHTTVLLYLLVDFGIVVHLII